MTNYFVTTSYLDRFGKASTKAAYMTRPEYTAHVEREEDSVNGGSLILENGTLYVKVISSVYETVRITRKEV